MPRRKRKGKGNNHTNSSQRTPIEEATFEPGPVEIPTDTEPGSHAKLATLRQRAELGVDLWHPEDFTRMPGPYEVSYCNDDIVIATSKARKVIG